MKRIAIGALISAALVLAWLPSLRLLTTPSADQIWESFGIADACASQPARLGWLGSGSPAPGAGMFTPSLAAQILVQLSCRLSRLTPLLPLQAALLLGQALTLALAWLSCRWAGFRQDTSLLAGFLIATAPCAFSRIGHLGLASLIPVIPTLITALQLHRALLQPRPWPWPRMVGIGLLGGLLSWPSQDYYVVFSLLLLGASLLLHLLVSSGSDLRLGPPLRQLGQGALVLAGYGAVVLLLYLPKILATGEAGPPGPWGAPRFASEQFLYGLLPLTWWIPPPWVPSTLEALRASGIDTGSESYFWSSGSLLIPISWIAAIRRLAQPARNDPDRRFLALLLLLTSALGLLVMTMGGLGTLFAALLTPVLRSLNRFTVYVYGAALLYLVAEFDLWLRHRDRTH